VRSQRNPIDDSAAGSRETSVTGSGNTPVTRT
jgi:hypothetical protein